ncbi:MAG: restriction endonuclease subunit S [Rothia sp. (in: high G+C Gram-positive bacteria)]|nr:restriction endonuclease subunit S [Rothia sp. (in: high G+C Gram-positive bacteria)]
MSETQSFELGEFVPKTQNLNPAHFPDETFELLSIPAFDAGSAEHVLGSEFGSSKQVVFPGDVMISKIIPHIRRVWVVPEPNGDYRQIASGEWIVFRTDKVLASWLRHYLLSDRFHAQFLNTVAGVGGSLVRARPQFVKKIRVDVPSKEVQESEALAKDLQELIEQKRERQRELLNELEYAVFQELFERETSDYLPLGKIIDSLEGGKNLVSNNSEEDTSYRVLKISAVTKENFSFTETKPLPADYTPPASHIVKKGDLLISRANTSEMVGAAALVGDVTDNFALPDKIWKFVWNEDSRVTPEYIYCLLRSPKMRREIQKIATGTSGSMKNISKKNLLRLNISIPKQEQLDLFNKFFQHSRKFKENY